MTAMPAAAQERRVGYIAWITVCVVWGTTYLAIHVALETMPVALLAGFRWAGAGLVLTALLPLFGERLPGPRSWGPIALVGFLMNVLGNGFVVWAQQHVASGLTAVVVAMVPFWTVGVEALLPRGERLTARTVAGLTVGLAGIVVLVWPQIAVGGSEGRLFLAGVVSLQMAGLAWALGSSYTKRHDLGGSPLASSALQMLFSGAVLIGLGSLLGEWSRVTFTPRSLTALAYLTLAGSVVGYTAFVYALKYLPLSTVTLYAYVNPIIAVILGTLLLDEPFSARIVLAAALVFAGIAIVRSTPAMKSPVAVAARKAVA